MGPDFDPYGVTHKRIPSTQFLRHKLPIGNKDQNTEENLGTIGGGTAAHNLIGLGSLNNSELNDEYTMGGHNVSNINQIMSYRQEGADNLLLS